eukprot:6141054-Pleurochrysis_carterae.AAC.1
MIAISNSSWHGDEPLHGKYVVLESSFIPKRWGIRSACQYLPDKMQGAMSRERISEIYRESILGIKLQMISGTSASSEYPACKTSFPDRCMILTTINLKFWRSRCRFVLPWHLRIYYNKHRKSILVLYVTSCRTLHFSVTSCRCPQRSGTRSALLFNSHYAAEADAQCETAPVV